MIYGLFSAWGCQGMSVMAIENHLRICDKIFVCIQSYNPSYDHLGDGTAGAVQERWGDDDRVTILPPGPPHTGKEPYGKPRCNILKRLLAEASPVDGDVIMICDADEFFDDNAVLEIKKEVQDKTIDLFRISGMFMVLDGSWYVKGTHGRFVTYKKGMSFTPTQNPVPAVRSSKIILLQHPMHHYSMVAGMEYKKICWSMFGTKSLQKSRIGWIDEIYSKWDPENIDLCKDLAEKNESITGHLGFWVNDGVEEPKDPPYLYRFDGQHQFGGFR